MRTDKQLLQQALKMYAILGSGPKAPHTEEVLGRLQGRIALLSSRCELQDVLRIHQSLDAAEVPENSGLRSLCQNALLASMVRLGRQIPAPAATA